jgi:hypothetical protein
MRNIPLACVILVGLLFSVPPAGRLLADEAFGHRYAAYGEVLARHVHASGVDYASLKADRGPLDRVVAEFDSTGARNEPGWSREQRMAYWINAYNAFTLRVIVDHYPIRSRWFTLQPRNSIRQIDGVWTRLQWHAAGQTVTLDDIEHKILRPTFQDARVHFALNCASASCPPLAAKPYSAEALGEQLNEAARIYLASAEGLRWEGNTFRISSIFKWYGDDFIAEYAPLVPGGRPARDRAILGAIAAHAPPPAAALARTGTPAIEYLDYDWSLNDVRRR